MKSFKFKPITWIILATLALFFMFFCLNQRVEGFTNYPDMKGSWEKSCRNSSKKNGVLSAECKNRDGIYIKTSLDGTKCKDKWKAKNDNGILKCE